MLSTIINDPNNNLNMPPELGQLASSFGDFYGQDDQARAASRLNVDVNKDIDPYRTAPFRGYMGYQTGGPIAQPTEQDLLMQTALYDTGIGAILPEAFAPNTEGFSMLPQFPDGGWTSDMFSGLYNLGTKRGRRKQKQLERRIDRANRGKKGADRRLTESQNMMKVKEYTDAGYEVTGIDPMTGELSFSNPGTGEQFSYNPQVPSGFEKFNAGISDIVSTVLPTAMGALIPGARPVIQGMQALTSLFPNQSGQPNGMGAGMGSFGLPFQPSSNPSQLYSPAGSMFDILTAGGGFGAPVAANNSPFASAFAGINPNTQSGNTGIGGVLPMYGLEDGGPANPFAWMNQSTQNNDPFMGTTGVAAPPPDPRINRLSMGLHEVESSSVKDPYTAHNKQTNALGKYQFLPRWHRDSIKQTTGIDVGTKAGREEFKTSPELQEEYFQTYTKDVLIPQLEKSRRKHGKALDGYSDEELMAVLHYNWTGGVDEIAKGNLDTNPTQDSSVANVTYGKYLSKVRKGIRKAQRESAPKFEQGGPVSMVPIQTEKGEMVLHPDGTLSPVNATKLHKYMDDDEITDIIPESSYIFSNSKDIRMDRDEAEGINLWVKAKPYKELLKGDLPEFVTLSELFGKEKRMTPAGMAKSLQRKYPVIDNEETLGENDMFTTVTNQENMQSRIPFITEIVGFNEAERTAQDRNIPSFGGGGRIPKADGGGFGAFMGDALPIAAQVVPLLSQLFGGNKNDQYAGLPGQVDPLSQSLMLGSYPLSSLGINRNIQAQMDAYGNAIGDYGSLGQSLASSANKSAQGQAAANMAGTVSNLFGQLGQDFGEDNRYDFSAERTRLQNFQPRAQTRAAVDAMSTPVADIQELARSLGAGGADAIAQMYGQNRMARNNAMMQSNQAMDEFDFNRINQMNQLGITEQQGNIPLDLQANEMRNQQLSNVAGLMGSGAQRGADIETGRLGQLGDIQSQLLPVMSGLNIQRSQLAGQNAIQQAQQLFNLGATLAALKNQNKAMAYGQGVPQQQQPMDALAELSQNKIPEINQQVQELARSLGAGGADAIAQMYGNTGAGTMIPGVGAIPGNAAGTLPVLPDMSTYGAQFAELIPGLSPQAELFDAFLRRGIVPGG